jgi:hypothetical protein
VVAARALWIVDEDERRVVCTNTPDGPMQRTDTVVVVAGEHDGREDYGISFAQAARAPVVVCRIPKRTATPSWRGCVTRRFRDVRVLRPHPSQLTTRGKADTVHSTAAEKGWSKVIVVTW